MFEMLKMILLTGYVVTGAVMDLRTRSVPYSWLIFGGLMSAALVIGSLVSNGSIRTALGGIGVGLPFLLITWVSPKSFGRADGAVIAMIGAVTGAGLTARTLCIALLLAAAMSVRQIVRCSFCGRGGQTLAFLPCLAVGLIGGWIL